MRQHALSLTPRQARSESATNSLRQLHWLPIQQRITFKIAVFTFKALHGDLLPVYMQQPVRVYTPARRFRSPDSNALLVPRSRSKAGHCTFAHAAAAVWNALPISVTSHTSLG